MKVHLTWNAPTYVYIVHFAANYCETIAPKYSIIPSPLKDQSGTQTIDRFLDGGYAMHYSQAWGACRDLNERVQSRDIYEIAEYVKRGTPHTHTHTIRGVLLLHHHRHQQQQQAWCLVPSPSPFTTMATNLVHDARAFASSSHPINYTHTHKHVHYARAGDDDDDDDRASPHRRRSKGINITHTLLRACVSYKTLTQRTSREYWLYCATLCPCCTHTHLE